MLAKRNNFDLSESPQKKQKTEKESLLFDKLNADLVYYLLFFINNGKDFQHLLMLNTATKNYLHPIIKQCIAKNSLPLFLDTDAVRSSKPTPYTLFYQSNRFQTFTKNLFEDYVRSNESHNRSDEVIYIRFYNQTIASQYNILAVTKQILKLYDQRLSEDGWEEDEIINVNSEFPIEHCLAEFNDLEITLHLIHRGFDGHRKDCKDKTFIEQMFYSNMNETFENILPVFTKRRVGTYQITDEIRHLFAQQYIVTLCNSFQEDDTLGFTFNNKTYDEYQTVNFSQLFNRAKGYIRDQRPLDFSFCQKFVEAQKDLLDLGIYFRKIEQGWDFSLSM